MPDTSPLDAGPTVALAPIVSPCVCGGEAQPRLDLLRAQWAVQCPRCPAYTFATTEAEAVAAWNAKLTQRIEQEGSVLLAARHYVAGGRMAPCCQQPVNLTGEQMLDHGPGVMVRRCRVCSRRHIRMRAGAGQLGMTGA